MNNADTQRMIDLVERQTGYRVTVDVISGIHEHAQMISARPEAPAHIIRVNADYRQHADYIVAVQCGMLLVLWFAPTKVPAMAFEKAKCDYLAGKWAKTKQLAAFPADVAAKTANFYVESLLRQLNSTPLEIRVANLCYESCPSLRDMQAESFNAHLRQISGVFSPKIKALAPQDAFQKNVAMNAALALNWARHPSITTSSGKRRPWSHATFQWSSLPVGSPAAKAWMSSGSPCSTMIACVPSTTT